MATKDKNSKYFLQEDPSEVKNVEGYLMGFLQSLLEEQRTAAKGGSQTQRLVLSSTPASSGPASPALPGKVELKIVSPEGNA